MKVILEFAGMRSEPLEWPDQVPPEISMFVRNSKDFFTSKNSFEANPRIIKSGRAKFEWTGLYEIIDNCSVRIYSLTDFVKGD